MATSVQMILNLLHAVEAVAAMINVVLCHRWAHRPKITDSMIPLTTDTLGNLTMNFFLLIYSNGILEKDLFKRKCFLLFRGSITSSKSRYMDNHSNGGSNDRYSDRTTSSSSSAWANPNNGPQSSVKSFGGLQSVTNDVWVSH